MKEGFRKLAAILLYFASEIEARWVEPGSKLPLRRRYLESIGMRLPPTFFVGFRPTIRCGHNIHVGDRFAIGDNAQITAHAKITIGDDFTGASGLHIDSGDHDIATLLPILEPISIGSRVWCGINVTIIAGVTIGNDCVIGAGSVVVKSIPDGVLAVGVPAKVVKTIGRSLTNFYPILPLRK